MTLYDVFIAFLEGVHCDIAAFMAVEEYTRSGIFFGCVKDMQKEEDERLSTILKFLKEYMKE
jgi:hypothetical protein